MNRLESFIRALGLCAILLLTFVFTGCETLPPTPKPPSEDNAATSTIFQRGDKLTIQFSDAPINPPVYEQTVREDGTISLPHNQSVLAAGKSKGELEQAIYDVYVPKFYRRMTVNIKAQDRFFFVTGEVRNPGQRVHTGYITALMAVGAAGDFTDFADKTDIQVIRADGTQINVNGKKALKNPELDVPVYPNDRVHVGRRFW